MKRVRTIILGAGPSGLSLAHGLLRHGDDSFVVLEKEDVAGGLCRSAEVDGAPWPACPDMRLLLSPSRGYGRVWRAMGAALGEKLICNRTLRQIDVEKTVVDEFIASRIVTTIPWCEFAAVASGIPSSIERSIAGLLHAAIEVAYHGHNVESAAHWTYIPDPAISHHRILFRHNFYPGSRGFWTETNAKRASKHAGWKHLNAYAYPLNVVDKPPRMARILEWAGQQHIIGLGRWGEWEHVNSDAAVAAGLALGRRLAKDGIAGPRK